MRLLWFSDTATPAVREALGFVDHGNRAGWVANAAHQLAGREDIEFGIVWASSLVREYTEFTTGRITYFCIPRGGWLQLISHKLQGRGLVYLVWQVLTYLPRQGLRQPLQDCSRIIRDFQPDVIHVHGTEGFYGLLGGMVDRPILVSMQGILVEYVKVYWGNIPLWKRFLFPREAMSYFRMKRNAARELRIIARNHHFSGRTHWDHEVVLGLKPTARVYYDGARLLRSAFYGPAWSLDSCDRCRLYSTVTARPYKGIDTLIDALALVRKHYPDARLRIGGQLPNHGYGAFVRGKIRKLELTDHVELIGFVEAEDIVSELKSAHAYLLGSHIENSPNSVAEAQTVGTPCIATSAGGTPSMVEDGISGLLYKAGDARQLAACICRIFEDDQFARNLSERERKLTVERGNIESNVDTLLSVYRQILGNKSLPGSSGPGSKIPLETGD